MAIGVSYTSVQPNGVTTTWVTILSIFFQPGLYANVQLGYFMNQSDYLAGKPPINTDYFVLNIGAIDVTQAMPAQIYGQIMASNGPCPGGTFTS